MHYFSKNLKILRQLSNISQKTIAEHLKIADRQYRRYENNEVDIPLSMAYKLADYFDVSTDYLLGRTDNPNSHKL